MSYNQKLLTNIKTKKSILCVGVDPHIADLRNFAKQNGHSADDMDDLSVAKSVLSAFVTKLFNTTFEYAVAYKPNAAFFEQFEDVGMLCLKELIGLCANKDIPVIYDFKRGDIGTTNDSYAHHAFNMLNVDCVTASGYMGSDSLRSFNHKKKGVFVLCKTSNPGSEDFQTLMCQDSLGVSKPLFMHVADKVVGMNTVDSDASDQTCWGVVIGATDLSSVSKVRVAHDSLWILAPGIGAQGGDLEGLLKHGLSKDGYSGLVVPISRGITRNESWSEAAKTFVNKMKPYLNI